MAQKRMFHQSIVESDAFIEMPLSAQALYFHLAMSADDDGFAGRPNSIRRLIGAEESDMQMLVDRKFIMKFDGCSAVLIKHWRVNNNLRADRHHETTYLDELSQVTIKEDGIYTFKKRRNQQVNATS